MIVPPVILALLCGLVACIWMTRHVRIAREKRGGVLLSPDHPGPESTAPKLSLIVAAKDEQDNIESCVRSLLSQEYPDFEVIACNDRGADRTGEILDRIAAEDARLRVIHVRDLPDGWKGKNHALHLASQVATGECLFFTDADCRLTSPRTLMVAVREMNSRGVGLLSILPNLAMRGFWENAIQPACSGVMMVWFEPGKVNDPAKPHAYANGAFILMRRDAYDAVGGHEAIRGALQEDMTLAQRVKRAGLGLAVVRSVGLYDVRMYTTLGQILRGWRRIFFGSFPTVGKLFLPLLLILLMGLLPYAAAVVGLTLAAAGVSPTAWWRAAGLTGVAAALLQLSVIYRYYKLIYADPRYFWTYPLGGAIMVGILLAAMAKHLPGAKLTWKGTSYRK
ncbi:MAG: glycosyltransferase [Phycisphaerae bacterium]|nr:glycosyltransferase [Phycisphaerae bacterium]